MHHRPRHSAKGTAGGLLPAMYQRGGGGGAGKAEMDGAEEHVSASDPASMFRQNSNSKDASKSPDFVASSMHDSYH